MKNKLTKDQKGFTIIEVLIVLAIAGLILLIVFLAVPALQRNNRNTQRSNDAARIAGAINECLPNNNGNLTLCDTPAELDRYAVVADNQQLINWGANQGNTETIGYNAGERCVNNVPTAGGGARAFAIGYEVETRTTNAPRCIGS